MLAIEFDKSFNIFMEKFTDDSINQWLRDNRQTEYLEDTDFVYYVDINQNKTEQSGKLSNRCLHGIVIACLLE